MSEVGKNVFGAAQAVENALASTVKDFESGVGAFFNGGNGRTHEPEPVRETQLTEPTKEASQERTAPGQIVANQDVNGTPAYLVQTENAKGEPEKVLVEKGKDDSFQVGQDVTMSWGKDGQLKGMEEQRDYGI